MYFDYCFVTDTKIPVRHTQWAGVFLSCDVDDRKDYFQESSIEPISNWLQRN